MGISIGGSSSEGSPGEGRKVISVSPGGIPNDLQEPLGWVTPIDHTNWDTVSTATTSATFGQVTAARDPRVIQISLKFNF